MLIEIVKQVDKTHAVQFNGHNFLEIQDAIIDHSKSVFAQLYYNEDGKFYFPHAIPFNEADDENLKCGDYFIFSKVYLILATNNEFETNFKLNKLAQIPVP